MGKSVLNTKTSTRKRKAQALLAGGKPTCEVMAATGLSETTVWRYGKELQKQAQSLEEFKNQRADVLALEQLKILDIQDTIRSSWDKGKILSLTESEKRTLYNVLSTDFGIKYDKERLERGESTDNVGIVVWKLASEIRRRRMEVNDENTGER